MKGSCTSHRQAPEALSVPKPLQSRRHLSRPQQDKTLFSQVFPLVPSGSPSLRQDILQNVKRKLHLTALWKLQVVVRESERQSENSGCGDAKQVFVYGSGAIRTTKTPNVK